MNVFLADITTAGEMNEAFQAFFGDDPPARITVGGVDLALGATVEIDLRRVQASGLSRAFTRPGSPAAVD